MLLTILILLKRLIVIPICILIFLILHYFEQYGSSAVVLRFTVDHFGGLFIKTIQFLASHHNFWFTHHEEYTKVLDSFYDHASEMHLSTLQSIFSDVRVVYDSIEQTPLASGSIAQVHRGKWQGKDVVFKIQKPIAKVQFQIDLLFIRVILCIITLIIGEIPSTPLLHEFINCVRNEFNFNREARAMICAKEWFADSEYITIPMVHLHSDKLIIMDFVDHDKISDSVVESITYDMKLKMCQKISDMFAEMILHHQFVHTDPHLGNICISKDKQSFIIFDWGQNKQLSASTVNGLAHIIFSESVNLDVLRYGMELCGIDNKTISIPHIMMVVQFFNNKNDNPDECWKLLRGLIEYTASQDRGNRNPFKKQSQEIVLILKTHDLLDVLMNKMGIESSTRRQMFPKSMIKSSRHRITHGVTN